MIEDQVEAVLESYHRRIAEEQARPPAPRGDGADPRTDPRHDLLLAVGPDTGRMINILARSLESPVILEIGTSFGYSTIWLAEAARASGGRVITLELHPHKSAHARNMAEKAGLAAHVDFRVGDALELIAGLETRVDFVLLDLWKEHYVPCLEAFYPRLNPGAIIVADNMIMPGGPDVARYGRAVRAKAGMRSVLLPVGMGIEVSRLENA